MKTENNTPETPVKTCQEVMSWALKNTLGSFYAPKSTDFQKRVAEEIQSIPEDEGEIPEFRHQVWGKFCQSICLDVKTGKRGPQCLGYAAELKGEWEIKPVDLEFLGSLGMWVERGDDVHRGHGWATNLMQRLQQAAHSKRLYQAYVRFQATGVTREHGLLAPKMRWEMNLWRGCGVSLFVQGKRPFGNSGVEVDVFKICGWELGWQEEMTEAEEERAWDLFDELVFAVPEMAREAAEKRTNQAGVDTGAPSKES